MLKTVENRMQRRYKYVGDNIKGHRRENEGPDLVRRLFSESLLSFQQMEIA